MRLALSQVEDALKDPATWARKLAEGNKRGGGNSRAGALLHAVGRYHRSNDNSHEASAYLDQRLTAFKEGPRNEETRSQLDWYIAEWEDRKADGWLCTKLDLDVAVRCPMWTRDDFRCTGRVARFDVVPQGGYAAWVMTQASAVERLGSIEPVLIQFAVADHLNVPTDDVAVGMYGFQERFVGLSSADAAEIQNALAEFWRLLRALGLERQS